MDNGKYTENQHDKHLLKIINKTDLIENNYKFITRN